MKITGFCKYLTAIISDQRDLKVDAACGDCVIVLQHIRELKPELVLLDLGLINQNSLQLVRY
jgi:DNA-binding NarL/FixJ family response regulator